MFWGLTLESGKRYAQQVETSFHVSMAALDVRSCPDSNESVSVMVSVDKNDFLLCNLSRQKLPQQPMDHVFQAGDQIAFMTKGKGVVHLTGYLMPDDDFPGFEDGEEEGEESSEEEVETPPPKSKAKDEKKRKSEPQNAKQQAKKAKIDLEQLSFDEDSDSDDSDFDEGEASPPGSEEEEEEGSDEVQGGDSDESGEEEDSGEEYEGKDDDDSEEDSDEEKTPAPKAKQQAQQQAKQQPKQQQQTKQQQQQAKQQKNTPNNKTPVVVNGTPTQQQSGKKNKNAKGETPKSADKQGQNAKGQTPQQVSPEKKTLAGGVMIEDLKVGSGPVAKSGRTACVYYCGRLKSNSKQFDATQSGAGFKFRVGQSEVIKGWDVGVAGMKVGGKRKIICPPHMAYGNRGSPPTIPPNSWLVFEVELRGVS